MAKSTARSKSASKRTTRAESTSTARKKRAAPKRGTVKRAAAKAARLKTKGPTQTFTVSHLDEADFKQDGLRAYAHYRDLGIAQATGGLAQAHVIRLIAPCTDEVRKRHIHDVELQLVYVLKGWVRNEFEGHGEQLMQAGSCWLQPPKIKHTVLDYSDDCELLEIIVPSEFATTEL